MSPVCDFAQQLTEWNQRLQKQRGRRFEFVLDRKEEHFNLSHVMSEHQVACVTFQGSPNN